MCVACKRCGRINVKDYFKQNGAGDKILCVCGADLSDTIDTNKLSI